MSIDYKLKQAKDLWHYNAIVAKGYKVTNGIVTAITEQEALKLISNEMIILAKSYGFSPDVCIHDNMIATDGDVYDVMHDLDSIFTKQIDKYAESIGYMTEPYGQGLYSIASTL